MAVVEYSQLHEPKLDTADVDDGWLALNEQDQQVAPLRRGLLGDVAGRGKKAGRGTPSLPRLHSPLAAASRPTTNGSALSAATPPVPPTRSTASRGRSRGLTPGTPATEGDGGRASNWSAWGK